MSAEPASGRAKSLTNEAFASFLLWLSEDHERAAVQYLEIRRILVKFFVRKGCVHSEELTDRTLDRAAAIVYEEPEKYSSPHALCCGVARKVWLESLREVVPGTLDHVNLATPQSLAAVNLEREASECEERCLGLCLDELSPREREMIVKYHQFQGSKKIEMRKRLAMEYGGLNKVRIAAYRIRVRLHGCISGCVRRSST